MSFLRILAALIGTLLLQGVATAAADPKQLDCTLADPGSVSASSQQTESRPVTVTFDEAAGTLFVSRDGTTRAFSHVTMTQSSVTGYLDDISLGIDRGAWIIVLQTYDAYSTRAEFGTCKSP